MKKKILCTICARKGSKGLPNKNILNLLGKPLIYHSLVQLLNGIANNPKPKLKATKSA